MKHTNRKIYRQVYDFPIGPVVIEASETAITGIHMDHAKTDHVRNETDHMENQLSMPSSVQFKETELIKKAYEELNEYFSGKRRTFDLPLQAEGTEFQMQVWKALQEIPYGETCSYKEIAIKAGKPKAFRAVGGACHRNPIFIMIPCHRVIGTDGSMTGYGGGIPVKKQLLSLEKA